MSKTQLTHRRVSPKRILGTVVALVVLFILLFSVLSVAQKYIGIRRHIRELATEQQSLKEKQERLATMNTYLETPEGAEEVLREKYNVVKPGEGVIVVVDTPTELPPAKGSAVSRWWQSILGGLGIRHK